jgi:type IV pilus assembly protein PilO
MDLSEINWDFNTAGAWPLQVKAAVILLICCLVAGGGVYAFTIDQLAQLDTLEIEEQTLLTDFTSKQKKAANLEDYQKQLAEIQSLLGEMMKQMPTKAEVASLLAEISQTALASGLESKLFQPENENKKDFYVELPYSIEMIGKYEELGLFISGVASMSRIVTVHDVDISTSTTKENESRMVMKATIKTYNEANPDEADDSKVDNTKGAK